MTKRAETYRLVKHFYDEGKLDSMIGIERVLAEDLELRRAWRDLKSAERALSRIIDERLAEAEDDE